MTEYPQEQTALDLTLVHCNGNPLRLKELFEASDALFEANMFVIKNGVNREIGELNPNMKRPTFTDYEKLKSL